MDALSARQSGTAAAPTPAGRVIDILEPALQKTPIVLASPHSGSFYSESFLEQSRLDRLSLRRSEDCHVDALAEPAARLLGAPLLKALFPRAYVDVNREPWELDPGMFAGDLPGYVNVRSPRVINGLGTVAKVVAQGQEIYRHKLDFAEVERRIEDHYRPYHDALDRLIERTRDRFGLCVLLDCHSMPSESQTTQRARGGRAAADIVFGDFFGASCDPALVGAAEAAARTRGFEVARNSPYAGGFITRHYGRPEAGIHVLQIEIGRWLYMNEATLERREEDFGRLAGDLYHIAAAIDVQARKTLGRRPPPAA